MKLPHTPKLVCSLLTVFLTLLIVSAANAGPGPAQVFQSVKTMKEAEAIKPGQRIAIACGNCGTLSITTAGADRSYLTGYTCKACGKKFVTVTNPHGGTVGMYVSEDDGGHRLSLYRLR